MTPEVEPRLSAWLASRAPAEVPPELRLRVAAIPRQRPNGWAPRLRSALSMRTASPGLRAAGVALLLVLTLMLALVALALVGAPSPSPVSEGLFTNTGPMLTGRLEADAMLLEDGEVLVVGGDSGGSDATDALTSAELYDRASRTFRATGSMAVGRVGAAATLLADGRALVVGGNASNGDPIRSARSMTRGRPPSARPGHRRCTAPGASSSDCSTAASSWSEMLALVPSSRQLSSTIPSQARSARPTVSPVRATCARRRRCSRTAGCSWWVGRTWTATPSRRRSSTTLAPGLSSRRDRRSCPCTRRSPTRLDDGTVLVLPGDGNAEVYDPATSSFRATGSMVSPHSLGAATLLSDGRVLVAGGDVGQVPVADAELYDPGTSLFSASGSMSVPRRGQTATLLPDGSVLVAGGMERPGSTSLTSAELFR